MKSLVRILVFLTLFIVIGLSFNLFYTSNDELLVDDKDEPVIDKELEVNGENIEEEANRPETGISTFIGKSADSFKEKYGEPVRIERSYYSYDWWIYNSPNEYLQVGVENNVIVTIAVAGKEIDAAPFKIGENLESVYQKVTMQPEVELEYEDGIFRFELFENDLNTRPLIPLGDIYAQLYFDNFEGELLFIRFMDKKTLLEHRPYDMTYRGELTESQPLTDDEWLLADVATEKQIFELTNLVRKEYSLSQLEWDEDTADVASNHSQDMFETNTFSHVSEKYGDLANRLETRNVFYESAGENIASMYTDSLAVVAGWLNSKGHRETFLSDEFTHLGVGVYKKYYTQNFIRKSWE